MVITEIEISPSSIAKCGFCGKIIGKGIPRGVEISEYYTNSSKKVYCYKCSEGILVTQEKLMKELSKELKRKVKKKSKEILAMEI